MKVKGISHAVVMVKDLEKARGFFADLFGTEFETPGELKEADIRNSMSPIGIELVSPLSADGPSSKTMERRGEGLALLALAVDNIEEAVAHMEARGIRLIGRPTPKAAQFHPKDLYGVMIELFERD